MTLATIRSPRFAFSSPRLHGVIIILVAFFSCSIESLAESMNGGSEFELARAYGFVLAQEMSLSYVAKEYPELSERVDITRGQFEATFPDIQKKLKTQLVLAVGLKSADDTTTTLLSQMKKRLTRKEITKAVAMDFLLEVQGRSMGKIKSPVLEHLLAAKYEHIPASEFTDGFRKPYQTTGLGNSRGIKLKFQLPQSWLAGAGDAPSTIQKWQSQNGLGLYVIALDIIDAAGVNPTRKDIDDYVKGGEIKSTLPADQSYVGAGTFSGKEFAGYWRQTTIGNYRAGTKQYVDMLQHVFYVRGNAIVMTCLARGSEIEKIKIQSSFKKLKPLCDEVVNSVMLL